MSAPNFGEHWQRLTSLATLGTARQALKPTDTWPAASELLAAAAPLSESSSTQLLRAAAATHLLALCSKRIPLSLSVQSILDRAEHENYCDENACWRLARLLIGDMRVLLGEWCALARKASRVLPPHWLPSIVQAANEEEKILLQPAMGMRAQWLAQQQSAGVRQQPSVEIDAGTAENSWQLGTLAERAALLKSLRPTHPSLARALIQQTWADDQPDARAAFLELLSEHVNTEDEPLLEAALDDKRKAVRVAAAQCLAKLKASAYQQRMIARVAPLLTFAASAKSGLFGMRRQPTLSVQLPQTLAADAIRDGIDAKPPAQRKIGERSYWLLQMLSTIEPSYWSTQFAVDPGSVLSAMRACDEADLLVEAIAAATVRHANDDWARVLCNAWVDNADDAFRTAAPLPPLLNVLKSTTRNALVTDLLGKTRKNNAELSFMLLDAAQGEWSDELTRLALDMLTQQLKTDSRQWAYSRDTLQGWGMRADIAVASPMLNALQSACKDPSPWNTALQRFCDIIEFRHAMRAELT